MKALKRLKLTKLNSEVLENLQMLSLVGGNNCRCGSCSASTSSTNNMNANSSYDYTGTGNYDIRCKCPSSTVYSTASM